MALAKGPFDLVWNGSTLQDIEEVDFEYEVDTEDFSTVQGRNYELAGAHSVAATITLLATDVSSLAMALPQYHVDNGGTLSTGEVVSDAAGAIDVVPGGCDVEQIYGDLTINSCGNPGHTFRIINARTEIAGIELDNTIRKVLVRFTGEASQDEATVQFFREGALGGVS